MSESGAERPILIARDGGSQRPQQWAVSKDEMIIGRGEECDIVLPVRQISRHHVKIYRDGDVYFIRDLDSKNGTWINGEPLKDVRRLYDGDEIHIALAVKLQYIGTGATAPLPFQVPQSAGGALHLDHEARRVFVGTVEINPPLSLPQYRLLELLANNPGRICTRDEVVEAVWPDVVGEGVSEQAIDALVRRLRDRLAEADPGRQFIVTVRGHGFRLDNA